MSKRPFFPQQGGDRKKAKLDVTISDHNFPLSQNGPNKEPAQDTWGDDNDDEILLLASQACEDAYNDSLLPDYSLCMQPKSTSTQLFDPGPSTSKATFNFKKPSAIPSTSTNHLKDKCNRISSPLPGISSKVLPKNEPINLTDDLIFNDKIYKGQDSDVIYKQLLQLQEENAKLKSENGKLLDKCVTKEGEASILRTQLKTYQVSVDNARMEKIKAQEKIQMEFTEKLSNINHQMHELRTQLDFKNLEIISIKERCKLLESNKVKLTQVTVANNDITLSQRMNSSFSTKEVTSAARKSKQVSHSVQTDNKEHFLKLNKSYRSEPSQLTSVLPSILEPTTEQHSLLEYNEKLQRHSDISHNKCRVYSTFHRIPTTPGYKEVKGSKESLGSLYEDVTRIAAGSDDGKGFVKLLSALKSVLCFVREQLECVCRVATSAFRRHMDERYIDSTRAYTHAARVHMLAGRPLFKEEQAILARRMTAVLAVILKTCTNVQYFKNHETDLLDITELLQKICNLLDNTYCAILYSGLLLSTIDLISFLRLEKKKTVEIIKMIISSRPLPFVCCELLNCVSKLCADSSVVSEFCPGSSAGNLRLDYDQGVLLYKKDSCHLQILLKQVESSLKCIARQELTEQALTLTTHLLALHIGIPWSPSHGDRDRSTGCDCQLILLQVVVYALRICAAMLNKCDENCDASNSQSTRLAAVCRSGVRALYVVCMRERDGELCALLAHAEGHLLELCELLRGREGEQAYVSMLNELSATFQSSPEDSPASFHRDPWTLSFDNFTITD